MCVPASEGWPHQTTARPKDQSWSPLGPNHLVCVPMKPRYLACFGELLLSSELDLWVLPVPGSIRLCLVGAMLACVLHKSAFFFNRLDRDYLLCLRLICLFRPV